MTHKYCPHCKALIPVEQFYSNKARKDGLTPLCKAHSNAYLKTRGRKYTRKSSQPDSTIAKRYREEQLVRHPLLWVWAGMKQRCTNPKAANYKHYGGCGIKVCQEWSDSVTAFESWAFSNGYALGLQLDRIDGSGNYEPSNCHWVTSKENNRNKRNNVWITAFGETKLLEDWLNDPRCEVTDKTLHKKLKLMSPELAMSKKRCPYVCKNESRRTPRS